MSQTEIVEKDDFHVGMSHNHKFNIENMKEFDITEQLKRETIEKHFLYAFENAMASERQIINTISKEDIVIIISGLPGCGKSTIAKIISERFGFKRVSGGDALKELAIEKGFKPGGKDWWESPDGDRFLNLRYQDNSFDTEVDRKLIEMGKKGNIILDGWVMPWLFEGGFKIWLEADRKTRAGRIAERDQINSDVAMKLFAEREEKSYLIYKNMYNIEFGKDFSPFDITLRVDNLSPKQIANILSAAICQKYQ